jgi:hypothetical protein
MTAKRVWPHLPLPMRSWPADDPILVFREYLFLLASLALCSLFPYQPYQIVILSQWCHDTSIYSVAQRKHVGLITQRSEDQNLVEQCFL